MQLKTYNIFDRAEKVVTIRISAKELNAINELKMKHNAGRYHHKITTSELIRKMIMYCLNNEIKDY